MVVGGAVVVVDVEADPDMGRTGGRGTGVEVILEEVGEAEEIADDVVELRTEDLGAVRVDVVDTVSVCVDVETAVEASVTDVLDLVEDDGDAVIVGLMIMVAVD